MDAKLKKASLEVFRDLRRTIGIGLNDAIYLSLMDRVGDDYDKLASEFSKMGEAFENAAKGIQESEVRCNNFLNAALYFHFANIANQEDFTWKEKQLRNSIRSYLKAAPLLQYPPEIIQLKYEDKYLGGYFRKAKGDKNPAVIIIRGTGAAREAEDHIIAEYFLRKGMSTFAIDFPGQGEARYNKVFPLLPDNSKALKGAVDYLVTRPDVEANKIGIFGSCTGGSFATVAAAGEKRIKAVINCAGYYSLAEFEYPYLVELETLSICGATPETWETKRREFTVAGYLRELTCPILVVNGEEDALMPSSQTRKIYDAARMPKDLMLYPGIGHNVWYNTRYVLVECAKWMLNKLNA